MTKRIEFNSRAITFVGTVTFAHMGKYVTDFMVRFKGPGWVVTEAEEPTVQGDSLDVHVPDATRGTIIEALATMDDADHRGPELLEFPEKKQPWSPDGCVAEFLEDIRAGTIAPNKIMILWFSVEPNGSLRPHRWFANVTNCEEVALLELGKHIAIAEWKD